jgi:hypothetical protein
MRATWFHLFALFTLAWTARAQSITSFEPDTAGRAARRHAPRDPAERPTWVSLQVAPVTGVVSELDQQNGAWDVHGTPWIGVGVAWPLASSNQGWAALGYETFVFDLRPETVPFGPLFAPFISPLIQEQLMGRIGIDQLIRRDRAVSAAIGVGFGVGAGVASIPADLHPKTNVSVEVLAHAITYFRVRDTFRVGVGASGGPTYWIVNSSGAWLHGELELRLEHARYAAKPVAPRL